MFSAVEERSTPSPVLPPVPQSQPKGAWLSKRYDRGRARLDRLGKNILDGNRCVEPASERMRDRNVRDEEPGE